jgi:hypothetical protein
LPVILHDGKAALRRTIRIMAKSMLAKDFAWLMVFITMMTALPALSQADDGIGPERIQPPAMAIGVVTFANGRALNLSGGIGGGAAASSNSDEFFAVSDHGPVLPCSRSVAIVDMDPDTLCEGNGKAQIHPVPDYNPVISRLRMRGGKVEILETIPVTDRGRRPVTGLPNPLASAETARAYGSEGQVLGLNPAGLDPRALLQLPDGRFLIGDAHGPSLVLVDSKGMVIKRLVPKGMLQDVRGADYDIEETLPAAWLARPYGTAVSGLALSADKKTVLALLSRPLQAGTASSRGVLLDAQTLAVKAETDFPMVDDGRELAELVTVGQGQLLAIEVTRSGAEIFIIALSEAGAPGASPFITKMLKGSVSGENWAGLPIGAAVLLDKRQLLLISDNLYGLTGGKATIYSLDMARSLPQ